MSVTYIDPPDWNSANSVQVDSNAATNMAAIHEINEWAAANGFERVNEYWLRQRQLPGGVRVFRGVCIRLTQDELASRAKENRAAADRAARMPATPHVVRGNAEAV